MNDYSICSLQYIYMHRGDVLVTKLLLSLLDKIYIEYTTEFVVELGTDKNNWNSNYMHKCSVCSEVNIHI
jgi:hypothetical protein